jgi:hypothetical protein
VLERVTGVVTDQKDYRTDFETRVDPWATLLVPVLKRMGVAKVVRRTNPTWRRSIERILEDAHRPKSRKRGAALKAAAMAYAAPHVESGAASEEPSALAAFLAVPERAAAHLCACGGGLVVQSPRAKWFSEAHRKRASRGRDRH